MLFRSAYYIDQAYSISLPLRFRIESTFRPIYPIPSISFNPVPQNRINFDFHVATLGKID